MQLAHCAYRQKHCQEGPNRLCHLRYRRARGLKVASYDNFAAFRAIDLLGAAQSQGAPAMRPSQDTYGLQWLPG